MHRHHSVISNGKLGPPFDAVLVGPVKMLLYFVRSAVIYRPNRSAKHLFQCGEIAEYPFFGYLLILAMPLYCRGHLFLQIQCQLLCPMAVKY